MAAYYNENDPKAAAWLRELIKARLIADGEVDERSITDVQPGDLAGFVQCHFFAGIGGWSYAMRLAGWPDERPGWTGSCPCQPFSVAGTQAGGADPRHLWPAWFRLIRKRRPVVVFGEQVESAIGHGWIDLVQDDLEGEDYACGPVGLPSAGVGAYDNRPRLWFVADDNHARLEARRSDAQRAHGWQSRRSLEPGGAVGCVADSSGSEWRANAEGWGHVIHGANARRQEAPSRFAVDCEAGELADAYGGKPCDGGVQRGRGYLQQSQDEAPGFWSDAEWIPCTDGKWRPVEPGTFPLAHGIPARVGRLRGYGNAINPWVAKEVIAAYMEICEVADR
jgi:DNA (cytosine-5)-methyltransferase 1